VTWAMDGERNFLGKAIGLVLNVESFLGPQFEKGLAQMKTAAETNAERRQGRAPSASSTSVSA
jgi:hypothetical protein